MSAEEETPFTPASDDLETNSSSTRLPGSVVLAEKMERSRFLRRASSSLFMGFVAVSSGTAGLLGFLASPAQAAGACCPTCCGPSPCCNTTCCQKGCCHPVGAEANCENNGVTCFGFDNTWSGSSCWGCVTGQLIVVCCDCVTNSRTNCPNPEGVNRCICYSIGDAPSAPKNLTIIRDASEVPRSR